MRVRARVRLLYERIREVGEEFYIDPSRFDGRVMEEVVGAGAAAPISGEDPESEARPRRRGRPSRASMEAAAARAVEQDTAQGDLFRED